MLKQIVVTVAVLFGAACIDDGVHGTQGSLPTEESPDDTGIDQPSDTPTTVTAERPRDPDQAQMPECSLLPQDGSACAHACDTDALLAFVPKGTCATFSCPLTDGTTFVTGACN